MNLGDALVDPRFWFFLCVVGTPMLAIEILVLKGASRLLDHIERWLMRKVGVSREQ